MNVLIILFPNIKSPTSMLPKFFMDKHPQTVTVEFFGIFLKITPVKSPPIASQQVLTPIFSAKTLKSVSKFSYEEFKTYLAPYFLRRSTCSALRTTLITSTPSFWKILLTILPRAEAAAVKTTLFYFFYLRISSMPKAVSGLTIDMHPSSNVVSSLNGKHYQDLIIVYWAQDPSPCFSTAKATFFPTSPQPISPPPLSTTRPEPSNPIIVGNFFCFSQLPVQRAKSEGLIGAAITLTRTSPDEGLGIGTSMTENLFASESMIHFIVF